MVDILIIFKTGNPVPMVITPEHLKMMEDSVSGRVIWCESEQEAIKKGIDAEILFIWGGNGKMPVEWCCKSRRLKMIYAFSAGVDPIMQSDIANLPIRLTNARGVMAKTMAVSIVGYIISFLRFFPQMRDNQAEHIWSHDFGGMPSEPEGKTLVIVGAGAIGTETAKLAKALGMKVIGVKRTPALLDGFDKIYLNKEMDEAIAQGDFVLATTPLTQDTYHLFNMDKFRLMKKTAVFMNTSRGKVVNECDLIEALNQHVIKGAALDCFEEEPLPADSPLWDMKNVIISPHFSAPSEKFMDRAVDIFCENVKRFENGQELINEIPLSRK